MLRALSISCAVWTLSVASYVLAEPGQPDRDAQQAADPPESDAPAAGEPIDTLPPPEPSRPASAEPDDEAGGGKADDTADGPAPDWLALGFRARVMTGYALARTHPENGQTRVDDTEAGWFLDQAVVEAEIKLSKRIEFELGFNVRSANVRDAFVNVRAHDALQLRVGRFKRPFSRLELRGRGKLPFRSRGLFNTLLTDSNFAGRELAGMVWGKPIDSLRYFVALANPASPSLGIEGADLIGRVVYDPSRDVSIGINAIHKWTERVANGPDSKLLGVGIDTKLDFGPLSILLEADAVENPTPPPVSGQGSAARKAWALGLTGYGEYTFKLSKKWTIAPVLVLEWLDTDTDYSRDERIRAVGGLSWNYRKRSLRMMPQLELTRPLGRADVRGEVASETFYLLVSAEI